MKPFETDLMKTRYVLSEFLIDLWPEEEPGVWDVRNTPKDFEEYANLIVITLEELEYTKVKNVKTGFKQLGLI